MKRLLLAPSVPLVGTPEVAEAEDTTYTRTDFTSIVEVASARGDWTWVSWCVIERLAA